MDSYRKVTIVCFQGFSPFRTCQKIFGKRRNSAGYLTAQGDVRYNTTVTYEKKVLPEVISMSEQAKTLPACPVETTLTLIGDKWKVLILRDLLSGTKRFGELKKSIGSVSQKVLTAQLRDMEDSGLLTRTVYAEVPPRVEYTLTELGYSLSPILEAMRSWGEDYKAKNW